MGIIILISNFVQVKLLRDVFEAWRDEVEKKPPTMSVEDAYEALGLERDKHHEEHIIRKAYYKLAQIYHPDKNPKGKVIMIKFINHWNRWMRTRIMYFLNVEIAHLIDCCRIIF